MQTILRPMSLGEILDRTAQLYRTNFFLFAGIAAVYAGVLLVLNLVQIGVQNLLLSQHMTRELPWVTFGFVLVIIPLMFISAGAAVAANNRAVAWVNLGQPATIRGAYASILPKLGRYLWLTAIIAFFIYLPFVLLFIAYFVFLFVYGRPRGLFAGTGGQSDSQSMVIVGLVTVAFFFLASACLVYAIVMFLRYSLAVPASVVEDLKARKAIRRSIELSKGSRGRVFVLMLLILVIEVGLAAITQVFFVAAAFTAVRRHSTVPIWLQIAQQFVGFFTNSFIGPMYATGLTLFYYDQRVRKEGYDIEWMMEAAGMTAAAIPAPLVALEVPPDAAPQAPAEQVVEAWPELPESELPAPAEAAAAPETEPAPEIGAPADGRNAGSDALPQPPHEGTNE